MARVSYRDFESKSNPQFLVTPSRITASWSVTELVLLAPLVQLRVTRVLYLRTTPINLGFDSPNQACPGDSLEIFGSLGFVACVLAVDGLSQAN